MPAVLEREKRLWGFIFRIEGIRSKHENDEVSHFAGLIMLSLQNSIKPQGTVEAECLA